jgi:hypothetical protein
MSTFKIKLEDKAAFLNRAKKYGVEVDTSNIKNNKLEGYFTATIDNPEDIAIIKKILRQSPKIDILREVIRKEIRRVISEIRVNRPSPRPLEMKDIKWDEGKAWDWYDDQDQKHIIYGRDKFGNTYKANFYIVTYDDENDPEARYDIEIDDRTIELYNPEEDDDDIYDLNEIKINEPKKPFDLDRGVVNLDFDDVDHRDAPDYSDAYVSYAEWADNGEPLTEEELDELNEYHEWVHDRLMDDMY